MSSNVIDFMARKKDRSITQTSTKLTQQQQEIVDISEMRAAEIDEDRREVRRTILTEFVSTYVVLPELGLKKISLYDVSANGVAFDLPVDSGKYEKGEQVAVRIYLNKNTYFPFVVNIANVREVEDDGVFRHGATIVDGSVNDVALHHFIGFIETVSTTLRKDAGDVVVNSIKS